MANRLDVSNNILLGHNVVRNTFKAATGSDDEDVDDVKKRDLKV